MRQPRKSSRRVPLAEVSDGCGPAYLPWTAALLAAASAVAICLASSWAVLSALHIFITLACRGAVTLSEASGANGKLASGLVCSVQPEDMLYFGRVANTINQAIGFSLWNCGPYWLTSIG